MKKLLNIIILTLISSFAFSQEITVTNFRCIENDITARTEKVKDQNGELCALIIVNTPIRGFEFGGCSIETTEQKTGAIYVYVSPGVKFITLMHKDYGMLKNYPFPETIKSGMTYEMVLKIEEKAPNLDSASMMNAMEQKLSEMEQRLGQLINQQNTSQPINNNSQPIINNNISNFKLLKSSDRDYSYVNSVAYSPDGTKIVSGSNDNTVKIWDVNTGQCLQTLKGHSDGVNSVAYSPDGTKIISGSYDNTIKIWVVE